jgi:hypothetical protein
MPACGRPLTLRCSMPEGTKCACADQCHADIQHALTKCRRPCGRPFDRFQAFEKSEWLSQNCEHLCKKECWQCVNPVNHIWQETLVFHCQDCDGDYEATCQTVERTSAGDIKQPPCTRQVANVGAQCGHEVPKLCCGEVQQTWNHICITPFPAVILAIRSAQTMRAASTQPAKSSAPCTAA